MLPLWSAWEEDSFDGLNVQFGGDKIFMYILCGGDYNPSLLPVILTAYRLYHLNYWELDTVNTRRR